jgi:hypothetical protein
MNLIKLIKIFLFPIFAVLFLIGFILFVVGNTERENKKVVKKKK